MGKINLSVGSCEKNGVMAGVGVSSSSETLDNMYVASVTIQN